MAPWHVKKVFEKGGGGVEGVWKIVRTSGKILATPLNRKEFSTVVITSGYLDNFALLRESAEFR